VVSTVIVVPLRFVSRVVIAGHFSKTISALANATPSDIHFKLHPCQLFILTSGIDRECGNYFLDIKFKY
jgi:hypothetical protein